MYIMCIVCCALLCLIAEEGVSPSTLAQIARHGRRGGASSSVGTPDFRTKILQNPGKSQRGS